MATLRLPSSLLALILAVPAGPVTADSCGRPFELVYERKATALTAEQRLHVHRSLAPYHSHAMQIESLVVQAAPNLTDGNVRAAEEIALSRARTVHELIVRIYPDLEQSSFVEVARAERRAVQTSNPEPRHVKVSLMCSRRDRFSGSLRKRAE